MSGNGQNVGIGQIVNPCHSPARFGGGWLSWERTGVGGGVEGVFLVIGGWGEFKRVFYEASLLFSRSPPSWPFSSRLSSGPATPPASPSNPTGHSGPDIFRSVRQFSRRAFSFSCLVFAPGSNRRGGLGGNHIKPRQNPGWWTHPTCGNRRWMRAWNTPHRRCNTLDR